MRRCVMPGEIRKDEDGLVFNLHRDEVGLITGVFYDLSSISEAMGSKRPEGVSEEDILVAQDLVMTVRTHWDGTGDEQKLWFIVDGIVCLHPEIIPWVQGFLEDGFQGGMRLFDLVAYAHNTVFQ